MPEIVRMMPDDQLHRYATNAPDTYDAATRAAVIQIAQAEMTRRAEGVSNRLTIIVSEGPVLTKTWLSPAEKPAPVKLPYRFRFDEWEFDGLDELAAILREVEADPLKAVIRGRLKQGFDPNGWHRRLRLPCPKTGDPATVEDVPRKWIMVDIDDPPLSNVDELQNRLPRELRGANYVGQISASAGHPTLNGKFKMHAWFMLDRALSSADCRAWLGIYPGIDVSMLTPVGIHFTAAPVIDAGYRP
ncbi:hypothetical protein ML401_20675 [Bradyrhizobium sp. 62B]|uniref:hypothetical protein n=1 Tax=Bradyrhizobium sp. 62B TaxID=2898442 RepID=UPI002557C813|nr:hypothetical protein ML401_20675 [Bradyrhizobium sp. 62B]